MKQQIPENYFHYQIVDRKRYMCIFYHHYEGGYFNKSNVEFHYGRLLFSILGLINDDYRINSMYEFKMEYPDIDKFINWKQEKRPQDATNENLGKVEVLYDDFKGNKFQFNGLRQSGESNYTFLDGVSSTWHFSIGQYDKWANGIIAGPFGDEYLEIKSVRLWMRVPQFDCSRQKKTKLLAVLSLFSLQSKK